MHRPHQHYSSSSTSSKAVPLPTHPTNLKLEIPHHVPPYATYPTTRSSQVLNNLQNPTYLACLTFPSQYLTKNTPSSRFSSPQIHQQASIYARSPSLWLSIIPLVYMRTHLNNQFLPEHSPSGNGNASPRPLNPTKQALDSSHVICNHKH
jgi:hypothetical protein